MSGRWRWLAGLLALASVLVAPLARGGYYGVVSSATYLSDGTAYTGASVLSGATSCYALPSLAVAKTCLAYNSIVGVETLGADGTFSLKCGTSPTYQLRFVGSYGWCDAVPLGGALPTFLGGTVDPVLAGQNITVTGAPYGDVVESEMQKIAEQDLLFALGVSVCTLLGVGVGVKLI